MFKKTVLGVFFAGFIGLLIWGGINRSLDQVKKTAEAAGNGAVGNGRSSTVDTGGAGVEAIELAAGQAQVEALVELNGVVAVVDQLAATVTMDDGQVYLVEGRPWRFALEHGFQVSVGDSLRLTGFYDETIFEVSQIEDLTSGQLIAVRGETGRPLWAGGGNSH